jgi:hypothetical protein
MEAHEKEVLVENILRPERRRTTLEERVQVLEDKERIRDVVMQYAFLCDTRRHDELYALYTEDIERELGGTLTEVVKGKEALRTRHNNPKLERKEGVGGHLPAGGIRDIAPRHLMSPAVVRLSDDSKEAWASVYYSLVGIKQTNGSVERGVHDGSYLFHLKRVDDDWRVSRFTVFTEHAFNPVFRED